MNRKNILITGSTDGIGKQTAIELAQMGHAVIIHGRDKEKTEKVFEEIREKTGSYTLDMFTADLSSLDEVKKLCGKITAKYTHLDVLINNAGVYMKNRTLTKDGYETTFAVNHMAPFLLTLLLLPLLKKSTPSRIINVSSVAHQRGEIDFENLQGEKHFDPYGAYASSKLANLLFTYELARRLKGRGITVNALHPGVISTKLLHAGFGMGGASLGEGAETPVYLAVSPDVAAVTGKYFIRRQQTNSSALSNDAELQERFWKESIRLAGIEEENLSV